MSGSTDRSSDWTFIVYPDSVPNKDNWQEDLRNLHIPCAVSPLHDQDFNPTGDEKKAHWHVYIKFDSLKSLKQVKAITEQFNGTVPFMVVSPVGMIRYFIHKDNPEKHQYNWIDINCYNGFELERYDKLTESEIDIIFNEIMKFIEDENITEYFDLLNSIRLDDFRFDRWYRTARKNTLFFNTYITSRRNKLKEWMKQQESYLNK